MKQERTFRSRLNGLPLELRVKLGDVSFQKGMQPGSRRDKVIELFTEYNINFQHVGTGTNRVIVKYDGYVIKIALDKEGIADNKQEWVMAEQLAPHVAMAYEISGGGHLLVAEYAPAFKKYFEMTLYRDSIIEILDGWSKRFLLGDVGIIDKNHANWGLNAQGKPVCIDYAYVMPISMHSLDCICGSPVKIDSSYSVYKCTRCGTVYPDASLRMQITQEDRMRMFSNTPGLEMHQEFEQHPVDIAYQKPNSNPEYPDDFTASMEFAKYLIDTGQV